MTTGKYEEIYHLTVQRFSHARCYKFTGLHYAACTYIL